MNDVQAPSLTLPMLGLLAVGSVGMALAPRLLGTPEPGDTARLGIALSTASGAAGLYLKRRGLLHGMGAALSGVGFSLFGRLLLLMTGAVWVRTHGGSVPVFAVAFLVLFGASQCVELGYVVVAAGRRGA